MSTSPTLPSSYNNALTHPPLRSRLRQGRVDHVPMQNGIVARFYFQRRTSPLVGKMYTCMELMLNRMISACTSEFSASWYGLQLPFSASTPTQHHYNISASMIMGGGISQTYRTLLPFL
jgi:hypothetical protein